MKSLIFDIYNNANNWQKEKRVTIDFVVAVSNGKELDFYNLLQSLYGLPYIYKTLMKHNEYTDFIFFTFHCDIYAFDDKEIIRKSICECLDKAFLMVKTFVDRNGCKIESVK